MKKAWLGLTLATTALVLVGCTNSTTSTKQTIRVGYFPNITHAQALVGLADGTFQKELGDNVEIKSTTFNAGPAEIEALFAGQIDIGYVGPSPILNGYTQSNGEALQVISGAMSGGAALVLQPDLAAAFAEQGPSALTNKKIASPQQGNTQDISLRTYLLDNNVHAEIVPLANADQLTQFTQKQLSGSWAPEPWASRLVQETGAVVAFDESTLWPDGKYPTTLVVASKDFITKHPDLVQAWLKAHVAVTNWIVAQPTAAQKIVNDEIEKLTQKRLSDTVMATAWARLTPTVDPLKAAVQTNADRAYQMDFLGTQAPNLSNLYDLHFLNAIDSTQQY